MLNNRKVNHRKAVLGVNFYFTVRTSKTIKRYFYNTNFRNKTIHNYHIYGHWCSNREINSERKWSLLNYHGSGKTAGKQTFWELNLCSHSFSISYSDEFFSWQLVINISTFANNSCVISYDKNRISKVMLYIYTTNAWCRNSCLFIVCAVILTL